MGRPSQSWRRWPRRKPEGCGSALVGPGGAALRGVDYARSAARCPHVCVASRESSGCEPAFPGFGNLTGPGISEGPAPRAPTVRAGPWTRESGVPGRDGPPTRADPRRWCRRRRPPSRACRPRSYLPAACRTRLQDRRRPGERGRACFVHFASCMFAPSDVLKSHGNRPLGSLQAVISGPGLELRVSASVRTPLLGPQWCTCFVHVYFCFLQFFSSVACTARQPSIDSPE